jgi:hypothetical protein
VHSESRLIGWRGAGQSMSSGSNRPTLDHGQPTGIAAPLGPNQMPPGCFRAGARLFPLPDSLPLKGVLCPFAHNRPAARRYVLASIFYHGQRSALTDTDVFRNQGVTAFLDADGWRANERTCPSQCKSMSP